MKGKKELIVLSADKDIEYAVRGILNRYKSLGIRQLKEDRDFNIIKHPERDPGCATTGIEMLDRTIREYRRALMIFDHDGCGREDKEPELIEGELEEQLTVRGWKDPKVIVIKPELEIWVWGDSTHVAEVLGWKNASEKLEKWLMDNSFLNQNEPKPENPKQAMEAAMRKVKMPRSSSIYFQVAERVSLKRCTDRSFLKLKMTLQSWFPSGRKQPQSN